MFSGLLKVVIIVAVIAQIGIAIPCYVAVTEMYDEGYKSPEIYFAPGERSDAHREAAASARAICWVSRDGSSGAAILNAAIHAMYGFSIFNVVGIPFGIYSGYQSGLLGGRAIAHKIYEENNEK